MTCPVCNGTCADPAGWPDFTPMSATGALPMCWCCRGSGELPEGAEWRPEEGAHNRAIRLAAGVGLRVQARILGISAARLSEQERGLWRKE